MAQRSGQLDLRETSGPQEGATGSERAASTGESARGGLLSMVGTPIGNLSDASPRVIDTLRSADVLLCEDTRVTSRLLARFGIRVPLERCDENVIAGRVASVLSRLEAGEHVTFVSDAGMPGVSDPGQRLVDAALDAGLAVEVVPGPSAVTCALVASGLPMEHFYFEGFLPRKRGDQLRRLRELAAVPGALVVYESPHRVAATLGNIAEALPERQVALVRELTKVHEEVVRDVAPELAAAVAQRDDIRGECVIVVAGPTQTELEVLRHGGAGEPLPSMDEAITAGIASGEPKSALAKRLAKAYSVPKSEVYDRILEASR